MLLRCLLAIILLAWLDGVWAAEPLAMLLASPCRDGDVETALRWELSRHNWVGRGWTVRNEGAAFEVTQTVALNKMSGISFGWRVDNDVVTAATPASVALCSAH